MGKMTCPFIVVAAIAIGTADGRAQTPAAGDRAASDPLLREVRLLRQAVERLTVFAVRSHLAVTRLVAQQQRVAREQDAVDRAEAAIADADRSQERMHATLARLSRQAENVVEEPRSELRREVESLRGELEDQDRQIERLRAGLSNAEQSLRTEQQSYRQLEATLLTLDRELQSQVP
jgi:chromosome segregation ATPase